MSKKDYYIVEKNVSKIKRQEHTNFLDYQTRIKACQKLKGYNYQIYYPFQDSEKTIIYVDNIPQVSLLEIISPEKLFHKDIMGSLYNLNIASEMFGDIIITNNHYYFLTMPSVVNIIMNEYKKVGNNNIKIKPQNIKVLDNYHRQYQEITLIVSSLRIDNVISRLIGTSRKNIKENFFDDDIILNYEVCHKLNYNLSNNDIFSIKKNGKYKFGEIIGKSKKGNYIVKCYKYIDN